MRTKPLFVNVSTVIAFGLFAVFIATSFSSAALAFSTPWQAHLHGRTRVLIAKSEQVNGKTYLDGVVQHELDKGWKTYWRYAGDAGLPLTVSSDINKPALGEVELMWPAPERVMETNMQSFIYSGNIAIPFRAEWKTPGKTSEDELNLSFMVCENICVPVNLVIPLQVKADIVKTEDKEAVSALASALKTIPQRDSKSFTIRDVKWVKRDAVEFIELDVISKQPLDKADVIVEGAGAYRFNPPGASPHEGGTRFRIAVERQIKHAPVPSTLHVTIITPTESAEYDVTPASDEPKAGEPTPSSSPAAVKP
ncbi:hypothetical protein GC177_08435 [bacterium]|nr:hypothetical protein [bacterium]